MSDEAAAAAAACVSATCGGAALKKGPWTAAEDEVLLEYVKKHGEGNWNAVQRNTGLHRCGKSCRLRWSNHLRPNLKKGSFSAEEELLILRLHSQLGNKWARMAAHLPGRTDNEIKNYWNTRLKRRQRAGLPIYPPDIHCQHRACLSPTNTPPLTPTLTDNKSHHYPQMPTSCMNPITTRPAAIPLMAPSQFAARPILLQLPMMKSIGGELTFQQSPLSSASPHSQQLHSQYQHQRLFHAMQYSNFNFGPVNYQPVFVKTELPSNQIFPGDSGNDAVLDAMLLETQCLCGGSSSPEQANGGEDFKWSPLGDGGDGGEDAKWSPLVAAGDGSLQGCQPTDVRRVSKPKDSGGLTNDDLGTKVKAEPVEVATPTKPSTDPVLTNSDWYPTHHHQDISNGIPLTEADDMRLEMQQLASSLSVPPVTSSWNSGTDPYSGWDSLPGICS